MRTMTVSAMLMPSDITGRTDLMRLLGCSPNGPLPNFKEALKAFSVDDL